MWLLIVTILPPGPEDQSEGEIIDSEGDPAVDTGIPKLENLKMSEEEQRDFDDFSLASVSVSKRPWRAKKDSKVSKPQPQNVSVTRQARPQVIAKAQSVKSAQSDQRSVQLRSVQDQPVNQVQFKVLASQGQGQRQGLGRPVVVRRDDIDFLMKRSPLLTETMKLCLKKNRLVQKLWTESQNFAILTGRTLRFRKMLWA